MRHAVVRMPPECLCACCVWPGPVHPLSHRALERAPSSDPRAPAPLRGSSSILEQRDTRPTLSD